MALNSPVVLAIAPGTRECGVAMFEGFKLIYYGVKTSHPLNSIQRGNISISKVLDDLFEQYTLKSIVLKQINQYQQTSPGLKLLVSQIKRQAELKHIRVEEISLTQVKTLFCKDGKPTQKKAFQRVAALYPELQQFQNRPNKWQNDYYAYIFSAMAVGLVCLTNLADEDN